MKSMKTGFLSRAWRPALARRSWQPAAGAFLATLLALPVHAGIVIPDDPLTTGVRVAPNILFVLDDSGSMAFDYMPDDLPRIAAGGTTATGGTRCTGANATAACYANNRNTLAYNPATTYETWVQADGNRMTGGTSYNAVYASFNRVGGGTINLADSDSCRRYNYNQSSNTDEWSNSSSSGTRICGGVQTFYVLQDAAQAEDEAYASDLANYYRFQILTDGRVIRSEWLPRSGSWPTYNNGLDDSGCTSTNNTSTWRDCTRVTPTGRSEAAERENYATWYSYHRSRMKSAKGGVSQAFAPLGNRVRVGFHTIHQRNQLNIPVNDGNDGRFVDNIADPAAGTSNTTSRSQWYSRLHSALGQSGTPLIPALNRAGGYFERTESSGPYGPQASRDQFTCRQNFTILTTDGYWNEGSVSYGNVDGGSGPSHTGPNNQSYTYVAAAPYSDGWSNTLADVAMRYWKHDLRGDMTNNVPTSNANPAFWQHMVTFGISIGLSGRTGWGSVDDVPADASWPQPVSNAETTIDDLLHAAVNGRGTFVSAARPDEFTAGLQQALAAINRRTSSYSNVAVNSVSLDTDTQVFTASYVAGEWTGALASRSLSSGTTSWTSTLPAWSSRRIFTHNGSTGATFPTSTQQAALARGGGPANYQVTGAANANYLKGDQSLEGGGLGQLRQRTGLLGDIVNSSPAYVKDTNSIYVGANDGMLHAFSASTGRELFAYVPNLLNFGYLSELSRGDYQHRFFVDGPIVVTPRTLTPGKNILVGSLGRGGKGLFGLDVSNPAGFGAGNVLWERGDTPGGHMGLVLGKPVLGKVPGGQNAVIIGNGPNSSSDRAVLIVLDLTTGNVIREIDTGAGSAATPNGLFKPVGVFGPDGRTIQTAYAGDMLGNVWKFNLQTGTAIRLFNTGGQPITGGVTTAINPLTRQRWVFFGTGRFLTTGDAAPPHATQGMYGFVDEETAFTRTHLTRRTMAITSGTSNGYPVRGFEASAPLPGGSKGWYVELPESGERIVQDTQVASGFLITASMVPSNDGCGADGSGYINAVDAFTGTSAPGGSFFDLGGDGSTGDDTIGDRPIGSVDLGVGMPTLPSVIRERLVVGGTAGESGGGGKGFGETDRGPLRWDRVSWREIRRD